MRDGILFYFCFSGFLKLKRSKNANFESKRWMGVDGASWINKILPRRYQTLQTTTADKSGGTV
jgi:hypothetical protein